MYEGLGVMFIMIGGAAMIFAKRHNLENNELNADFYPGSVIALSTILIVIAYLIGVFFLR